MSSVIWFAGTFSYRLKRGFLFRIDSNCPLPLAAGGRGAAVVGATVVGAAVVGAAVVGAAVVGAAVPGAAVPLLDGVAVLDGVADGAAVEPGVWLVGPAVGAAVEPITGLSADWAVVSEPFAAGAGAGVPSTRVLSVIDAAGADESPPVRAFPVAVSDCSGLLPTSATTSSSASAVGVSVGAASAEDDDSVAAAPIAASMR